MISKIYYGMEKQVHCILSFVKKFKRKKSTYKLFLNTYTIPLGMGTQKVVKLWSLGELVRCGLGVEGMFFTNTLCTLWILNHNHVNIIPI